MMTCELNGARGDKADHVYRVEESPCMFEHCMSEKMYIKAKKLSRLWKYEKRIINSDPKLK